MYDYFVTINTTDWKNSIYVPKSNGKITSYKNRSGKDSECWYLDSRGGKWTTLMHSMDPVIDNDTAVLAFWAKLPEKKIRTFMVEFFQENWEERVTIPLSKNSQYLAGKNGDYYLFSVPYTANQDFNLHITLSVNDSEIYVFPASESDLKEYESYVPDKEELTEKEDYRIVTCYKQNFPKSRFVGIKYGDADRVNGMFGWVWGQWFEQGRFETLERKLEEEFQFVYPDWSAYIGLMRYKEGEPFEYWIGMFLPEGSEVPEGFSYVDFDFEYVGICWVQGKEEFVYGHEMECYAKLVDQGMKGIEDKNGACWFFERYGCPRFTTPDKNGEIILDIGYFVEG